MELLTVNDKYDEKTLEVFLRNNIRYPKEGEIVSYLRTEKYPRLGKTGIIVAPYQEQYIEGEVAGVAGKNEVSFNKTRFTTLLGLEVTEEMLKEEAKNAKKRELQPVKIIPKNKENERTN